MKIESYLNFLLFLLSFTVLIQCSNNITNPIVRELTTLEKEVTSSSDEFGFKLFKKK
ncbi:MAG: hypothetical protein GY936_05480 [Ignavibacteriae bacterium]|nr:hypothetical protein [Ignavibacteriota bacterium]